MTAADRATVDRPAFLAGVRASGVIAAARLDRALSDATFARTAREAADRLVTAGALTRFQAERLLAGRSDGFVLGPYVILDHQGKTASGRVFKACHRTMNRLVAVKMLSTTLTATDEVREAIRAEARQAAKLAHPNLVTLLDVNQTGDRMYFVEEYLDGASLAAVITGGRLTVAQAGDIVRQVALGLQHAHEKGVAHGRLSPAAILLGKSTGEASDRPHVKVSGFGLGGFAAERESPAADFAYRAPEPFADPDTATPAADVYSLGCVLFHLLAGHPPVSPVPPIRYIRPEVPAAVAALLAAMLAEGPAARPTAEEVALRLSLFSEAVTGEGIDLNIPAATYSPATSILQSQSVVMSRPPSEPSPFAAMTLGINTHERTPVAVPVTQGKGKKKPTTKTKRKKKPARLHPLTATCVLLLIALGVTFALVLMLRRATAG